MEEDVKKLITIHTKNLTILEEQKAKWGSLNVPLHILNQIEDEKAEIRRIEEKLTLRRSDIMMSTEELLRKRNEIDEIIRKYYEQRVTIMFTDIVGSSGYFASRGNIDGLAMVQAHNELLFPIIETHSGRIIKTIGDAIMACFEKAINVVSVSTEMQKALGKYNQGRYDKEQIHIRIGIHTGSVISTFNDVYGDAVNVAARITSLANGDQILLSEVTKEEVKKENEEIKFLDRGLQQLKGISRPIRIYEVRWLS